MKRALLAGFLLVTAPVAAFAVTAETGSWKNACQSNQTTKSMMAGSFVCYTPAVGAATDSATPILAASACENIDVFLHKDFDGDGTACTVTWQLQACPPQTLTTDAAKNNACGTLAGVTALSGEDVKSNLAGQYIRLVGGGAGANIDSCRIVVKCAQPSEK